MSGTRDVEEGEQDERDRLGGQVREDVDDELAHVVEDGSALFHGADDRGEVVVHQDHVGRLARDVGSGDPHRDPDVCALERRAHRSPRRR